MSHYRFHAADQPSFHATVLSRHSTVSFVPGPTPAVWRRRCQTSPLHFQTGERGKDRTNRTYGHAGRDDRRNVKQRTKQHVQAAKEQRAEPTDDVVRSFVVWIKQDKLVIVIFLWFVQSDNHPWRIWTSRIECLGIRTCSTDYHDSIERLLKDVKSSGSIISQPVCVLCSLVSIAISIVKG